MASGITVDPSCVQAFEDMRTPKLYKYITFKIQVHPSDNKERIVIDYKAPKSTTKTEEDEREAFKEFQERLVELGEPRYALYDFNHTTSTGQKVGKATFIFWSPDSSTMKMKMLYASSRDYVKTAFNGIEKHHQCNDADELSYEEIAEKTIKKI